MGRLDGARPFLANFFHCCVFCKNLYTAVSGIEEERSRPPAAQTWFDARACAAGPPPDSISP
jgi:hypothetical protein